MNILINKLKSAFDDIHAENSLKATTKKFLEKEIQQRSTKKKRIPFKRYAIFSASAAVLVFTLLTYRLYFIPSTYIDIDVNPSIEIVLNRFDKVIDSYAYNQEGKELLKEVSIRYKDYNKALGILIDEMIQGGYTQENGLISVTLQSNYEKKEKKLLSNLETTILQHHHTAQVECFSVNRSVRDTAHHFNLSPAKYLAIQELIEVDPTKTIESCRNHSILEIKEWTTNHHNTIPEEAVFPDTPEAPDNNGNNHHNGHHH